MRLACGLPSVHPGHFNPLRAILPVPPALKAQVFASLRPLRADIVSGVFPPQDVDETLEGFVEMVDYLSEVLIQDLVVLRPEMLSNPIYALAPFCTAEFAEYSKELLAAMAAAPQADLRLTLDETAERGHTHTAKVLIVVLNAQAAAPAAVAAGLSPGARAELRDVHAVVCPRDAPAPRSLFAPERLAAPPLAPLTAAFDVKIVATWPTDAVPLFASGFDLAEYTSPEAVTKEWLFGRDDRQPAVKHLEAYYGPAKGALVKGLSWRNKQWAADASNKKDKAFAMRKPAFDYIEKHGEAAAVAEMHRLLSEYDGPKRPWRAMQHVLKQMRDARPGADARATIGAKGAATRALKRKRTDAPVAAPKRQRTDASPAP